MMPDPKDTRPEAEDGNQQVGREADPKATDAEENVDPADESEDSEGWTPLNSSNVHACKYEGGVLSVMFHGGREYRMQTSKDVFERLKTSSSPGRMCKKELTDLEPA
jgi:hypothetical protein